MTDQNQIHEDIPADRAWQVKRRIYVRCGYQSTLNQDMRALGAKWDPELRALWVGSTKKASVLEALERATERRDAVIEVKTKGLWLDIPYDAANVRAAAKAAKAVFDGTTKQWAFRDEESFDRVTEMRDMWITERDEAERLRQVEQDRMETEEREADKARAAAARLARRERVFTASGRTPTGEQTEYRQISTRRMNKATAHEQARTLGSVIKLPDGRRGVLIDVDIWFTGDEVASSICWHPETHDQAHWDFNYTVRVVEPTAEELDADAAKQAERADTKVITTLVDDAKKATQPRAVDRYTDIPDGDREGKITVTTGIATVIPAGELILTRDGRVAWRHPGYYDDYIATEGSSTDPDLVMRVRAVLAGGSRTRVQPGQMPTEYRVVASG